MSMTLRCFCAWLDNSCVCVRLRTERHRYNRNELCGGARAVSAQREEASVKTQGIVLLASLLAASAFAGDYSVPRLPDGTPDLQGVWTNATATPVERSPELGDRRAFTDAEAAAISKAAIAAVEADAAPSDPKRSRRSLLSATTTCSGPTAACRSRTSTASIEPR
jgi:hypothetical protein